MNGHLDHLPDIILLEFDFRFPLPRGRTLFPRQRITAPRSILPCKNGHARMTPSSDLLANVDPQALPMISGTRFFVTAAFVGNLLLAPHLATGQLACPPVAHSSNDEIAICAVKQEKDGPIFKLHVRSKIDYRDFTLWSDEATYNSDTGDVALDGHVVLDGGSNDEHIKASHGTYNVQSETGRFYDVVGTIGYRQRASRLLLISSEPFAFSGKIVDKTGPDHYVVHDGTVTTCKSPHPKWQFNTHRAVVTAGGNALIYFSTFRIRGIPLLYFPFATHPVDRSKRQSGLLMPKIGNSSSKGTFLGDSFYWAINKSMDAEIGAEYFSRRGWAQRGDFRARPSNSSYLNLTYFGVIDRGIGTPKVRQGGEEVRLDAVGRIGHNFRAVTDVDYLSSFVFRVAFYDVFNQAVNSEVRSQAFLSNTTRGFSYNAFGQRYQNFQSTNNGDVITILHAPSFDFSSVDRELGKSHFYWGIETAAEGLYRSEPSFRTPRLVGRFDAKPSVSLPLHFGEWSLRPEVGIRDTLYTEQLGPSSSMGPSSDPINRKALETSLELRPPVLERIFDHEILGRKLKHVIEPRVVYRRVMGVDNFSKILRFDERDILSDTNEVEYGVVTRLFAKRSPSATENCSTTGLPSPNQPSPSQTISLPWEQPDTQPSKTSNCPVGPPARELVSWELAQKYFLDTNFGGALVSGSRNVFTTTADFTAIAFLTSPRHLSPLISRLRIQPGSNVDAEWDLGYDFTSGRINASTAVLSYHIGQVSFGGGDTYLRIPGEASAPNNTAAAPASFHQFRMQLGYGRSNKRGLSGATAFGFDANLGLLQYSAVQTTYNWDCCGITVEYRRFALGTIRNDNQYFFTYSLANIGSFGNLMRKERLY
jgi:LPS-assembly protein